MTTPTSSTMGITDKQTAPHYSWGNGCDGWHLVQTEHASIIEERMPPGTSEIRHYHKNANQFFFVLRGVLSIEIDGNQFSLSAGQGIQIDAGQIHQVHNRASADAEFLVFSNPPAKGDRVAVES